MYEWFFWMIYRSINKYIYIYIYIYTHISIYIYMRAAASPAVSSAVQDKAEERMHAWYKKRSAAKWFLTKLQKVGRADKQTQNEHQVRFGRSPPGWPLQDIQFFIRGLCTSQYYSWHSTPLMHTHPFLFCNQYCAIYGTSQPPCFAIQHTILVTAISCKGQTGHL